MSALLAISMLVLAALANDGGQSASCNGAGNGQSETTAQQGETLADIARRCLGDAAAATELRALNGFDANVLDAGTQVKLPGPDRALAIAALGAAKSAVEQTKPTASGYREGLARLKEARELFRTGRYAEAAKAADGAWQLVSTSAKESTRFAVQVAENGNTKVVAHSGKPVRVEAEGVTRPLYAGQTVQVEKGKPPPAPSLEVPLVAPVLLTPTDTTQITQRIGSPTTIVLTWKATPGASEYEVEIIGPQTLVMKTERPRARLPVIQAGKYRWAVRSIGDGGAKSELSEALNFELVDVPLKLEVGKTNWK